MKGKLLIIFKSDHGYTRRYVEILGNALGCDAVPADKFRGDMLSDYDKVLFIGSIRGSRINGFNKIADYLDIAYKKLVVCGVGMLPSAEDRADRIKESTISVAYEKFIPVFYVQGGFDMAELSRGERISINMMVRQIKMASLISEDETFILNTVAEPIDEVKQANIQPLIDYLEGKTVDESLYSAPEITDEQEEKKFFEEMENAAKAPENKARALKKKLKK
ncbi:MAG: flavodoxin domain-containing protein [Clostridiales bacterium]|nr:flavodoxin domain-containing protein [Clostridiales bacterium]